MRVPIRLIVAVCCLFSIQAHATTWSEPWHREVVTAADAFGLFEVIDNKPDQLRLKLVKHIAGAETGPVVTVTSFHALRLTSRSASTPPEFRLPQGEQVYFYLKRGGKTWAIATPTAGYALTGPQRQVGATYRISPHQAVVEAPLHEDTQRCLFALLHGGAPCDARIGSFIDRAARLMQFVEDDTANLTARTLAAMLLKKTGAHEMKPRLLAYAAKASDADASPGIAIMDPRIGTGFPSLRQAVKLAGEQLQVRRQRANDQETDPNELM